MTEFFFLNGTPVPNPDKVVAGAKGKATVRVAVNCYRCGGSGHYSIGVCFLCHGAKISGYKDVEVFTAEALPAAVAKADFKIAKKAAVVEAKLEAKRNAKAALAATYRANNPEIAAALAEFPNNSFLAKLNAAIDEWGGLTPGQAAAVLPAAARCKAEARRKSWAKDVPEGPVDIKGEVVGIKWVDDRFSYNGGEIKKLIVLDDNGFKVYGTAPSVGAEINKGDRIEFKATVEKSKDDPKFGFYKRPRLAKILVKADVGSVDEVKSEA